MNRRNTDFQNIGCKPRLRAWIILAAGLMTSVPLWSQEAGISGSAGADRFGKNYVFQIGRDLKDVVLSPKNWEGKDVFNLAVVFGTGTVLVTLDQDINDWFKKNKTETSSDFFNVAANFGDGRYLGVLIAGLYATGELTRNSGIRRTALLSLESLGIASLFGTVLKTIIGRARPYSGEGSQSFHMISTSSARTSFPSGHSLAAFAVATSIAEQSDSVFVDVAVYSLATLVAVSRVHQEKHWASDVFVGSAIGYFTAKKVAALNKGKELKNVGLAFELTPLRQSMSLSFNF